MNNKGLLGIIGDMKEILPMWRMVRILQKDGPAWTHQMITRETAKEMKESGREEGLKNSVFSERDSNFFGNTLALEITIKTFKRPDGKLFAPKSALISSYMRQFCPEFSSDDKNEVGFKDPTGKTTQLKFIEIGRFVEWCINDERGFMEQDVKDPGMVCLTCNGDSFADRFGLVKEYIRAIGPIWGGVGFVVMAVIAIIGWFK